MVSRCAIGTLGKSRSLLRYCEIFGEPSFEALVAGLLSGITFALFSGQPLNLLGSTGPVYVFEKILFEMCEDQSWDYLSLRLWIGIWVGFMLLLLVMFDASAYVCYITRFTEELFATLVAFIFIMVGGCSNTLTCILISRYI